VRVTAFLPKVSSHIVSHMMHDWAQIAQST